MGSAWLRSFGLAALAATVAACGAKPDDPGQCSLKCGGAVLGPNDAEYQIRAVGPEQQVACTPVGFEFPISLKFMAYRIRAKIPAKRPSPSAKSPGKASSGFAAFLDGDSPVPDDSPGDSEKGYEREPIPGLSFNPIIQGTYKENSKDATPPDEYCSDSCGVMSLTYTAVCPAPGLKGGNSIYLQSGALTSNIVKVEITGPDATAGGGGSGITGNRPAESRGTDTATGTDRGAGPGDDHGTGPG